MRSASIMVRFVRDDVDQHKLAIRSWSSFDTVVCDLGTSKTTEDTVERLSDRFKKPAKAEGFVVPP